MTSSAEAIGVDVGLASFATLSDGTEIFNPRFFRSEEKALKRAQRKLSAQPVGAPQRRKQRKVVARVHERIANRRSNFAHQVSHWLVISFGLIVFEKLNVKGMVKNNHLSKSISDAAWSQLISYTTSKAAMRSPVASSWLIHAAPANAARAVARSSKRVWLSARIIVICAV